MGRCRACSRLDLRYEGPPALLQPLLGCVSRYPMRFFYQSDSWSMFVAILRSAPLHPPLLVGGLRLSLVALAFSSLHFYALLVICAQGKLWVPVPVGCIGTVTPTTVWLLAFARWRRRCRRGGYQQPPLGRQYPSQFFPCFLRLRLKSGAPPDILKTAVHLHRLQNDRAEYDWKRLR